MPKPRSAFWYYLAVWASGGLFIFVWLYLLLRDINGLAKTRSMNATALVGTLVGLVVFNQTLIAYAQYKDFGFGEPQWFAPIIIGTGLGAFLLLIAIIVVAYRFIALANHGDVPPGSFMGIIFLSFLWFASLPLVQSEVNRAIRRSNLANTVEMGRP